MREEKLKPGKIIGTPAFKADGSGEKVNRGTWQVFRPKVDFKKCISCKRCYTLCPEGSYKWKKEKPHVNYITCKGCMICVNECPVNAISKERVK